MRPQFDDLPIFTAFGANLVPQTNPAPTPYKYLSFPSLNVGAIDLFAPSRIVSPSSPNAISHGVVSEVITSPPSFTAVYPGSNVTSFDLHSLSFACVVTDEANANVPSSCVIQFTGNKVAGGQVIQSLTYTPFISATEKSNFTTQSLGSVFQGLKNVTIQVTKSTTTPTSTVIFFDDIKFDVYLKT